MKRVTKDLVGAMERLKEDQLVMEERWFRLDTDSGIELEEWKAVKSSA